MDVLKVALGHRTWLQEERPLLVDDGREMGTPVRARAELLAEFLSAQQVDSILVCNSNSICPAASDLEAAWT